MQFPPLVFKYICCFSSFGHLVVVNIFSVHVIVVIYKVFLFLHGRCWFIELVLFDVSKLVLLLFSYRKGLV